MQSFNDFKFESIVFNESNPINEGLFDKLASMFSKVSVMFKDQVKAKKSIDAAVTQAGTKGAKFTPKMVKVNDTYMVSMGDGKVPANDFSIAFTKVADMPDGSGLFQISATTSPAMLKGLVGTSAIEDLAKNNVMAIIAATGFEKGKIATMRIVKNVMPGGKDYVTKSLVVGAVPASAVQAVLSKQK